MKKTNQAIGILGGTFDPIHHGHLRMGLELYETLHLSKVHVIPCYEPPHRSVPIASAEQRMAMVEAAVEGEAAFFADAREIRRKGVSYTIDTLVELHQEMPNNPLCLLVGIDAFLGFTTWHHWEEILKYAHIIVAHRPQYTLPKTGLIAEIVQSHLQQESAFIDDEPAGGIFTIPITSLEISATDIRNQISMGKNPRYLLPNKVYDYILQHTIYHNIKN